MTTQKERRDNEGQHEMKDSGVLSSQDTCSSASRKQTMASSPLQGQTTQHSQATQHGPAPKTKEGFRPQRQQQDGRPLLYS